MFSITAQTWLLPGSVLLADCASDHSLRACVPGASAERRTWTRRFQLGQSGIRKLTTLPPPAAAAWLPVGLRTECTAARPGRQQLT